MPPSEEKSIIKPKSEKRWKPKEEEKKRDEVKEHR